VATSSLPVVRTELSVTMTGFVCVICRGVWMEREGVQEKPINAGSSRRNAEGSELSAREWTESKLKCKAKQ